ncbi:MutH/Sau3AI family endonuclease [Lacticaseibacillus sp. 866-1]|uniref:MutH/Sau3AI family endonuclease n=1 Tax=Lacticaseibacillus sp. 866-1 TaxID=2799576 RepID=UPI0019443E28|nr:MutH/Sau3AI family endonuclease [Lacticaseibacillus sp. 866-1]
MAASIETAVKQWADDQIRDLGWHIIASENETADPSIDQSLKSNPSKTGGNGGGRPDFTIMLDNGEKTRVTFIYYLLGGTVMPIPSHHITESDLLRRLNAAVDKTLGELDVKGEFDSVKQFPKKTGVAGNVIENSVIGYPSDNAQRPDLSVDGRLVEVKTTGLRYKKGKARNASIPYEAKEPMSITAVSPDKIVEETFYDSDFWDKIANLLLVFYLYDSDKTVTASQYANFPVLGYDFVHLTQSEIEILQQDWLLIQDFIRDVQARGIAPNDGYPALSSALRKDLMFLDTAPKWPHHPRIRFKRTVVSTIAERYFTNRVEADDTNIASYSEFDQRLHNAAKKYHGMTVRQLLDALNITWKPTAAGDVSKSIAETIVCTIFGSPHAKFASVPLFKEMGIKPKTLVLSKNGGRTEDTKFSGMDVMSWGNEDDEFTDSEIYNYFAETQFLVSVFKEPSTDAKLLDNVFLGFKRYSFSDAFIRSKVQRLWDHTRTLLNTDQLKVSYMYTATGQQRFSPKTKLPMTETNLMKSADNDVFVRGTGIDGKDKSLIVHGIATYRHQDIWVKGTTMVKLLENEAYL